MKGRAAVVAKVCAGDQRSEDGLRAAAGATAAGAAGRGGGSG